MIEATLTRPLRRAVSSYTGIVRTIDECLAPAGEPALFRATCALRGGSDLIGTRLDHLSGTGGTGASRAEAAVAAVGEALERYSASFVPTERLEVASARELGASAVSPERFALFAEEQYSDPCFPYQRFTVDTRIAWVEGRDLSTGRPAWLPAELVYLGRVAVEDRPIGYATSSGTACAETGADALFRGLCELLERDAFTIVWSARLSLPLLDWSESPGFVELDGRFFASTGLRYSAVDLSRFHGIPSVLGVVRAPRGRSGALGIGAGTATTIEQAWFKALAEAFSARAAGAKLQCLDDREYGSLGEGVRSFEDHIRFYADPRRTEPADFLDASPERVRVAAIEPVAGDAVAELCLRVGAAGSTPYAVDVTSPDVAELGLVVTKVIAPELCQLDVLHDARFLGGRRLYDVGGIARNEVNPYPHPFP